MNTKVIKVRFSKFLHEFKTHELKMVMLFLKLVLLEYDENPSNIFGKKSLLSFYLLFFSIEIKDFIVFSFC